MKEINSKLPNQGTTIFTQMSALANAHQAINLSQGFPNYDPPSALREKVASYLDAGKNQYTHMYGVEELRLALANKLHRSYGININHDQEINITAGATQAIFTAITAFVHPGDEVIVFEPAFDCYIPAIKLAGGKVIPYEMQAPDFKVDWQ